MTFVHAVLEVLDQSGRVTDSFPVQFNPTTLSLSIENQVDGATSKARQRQQALGSGGTTLSMDLEFDTADEGTDVRELTKRVARFMEPGEGSETPPPGVGFVWGTIDLEGTMTSYSEELSLFSPDGSPLRARVSITIRGQDPRWAATETGPGSRSGVGAAIAGGIGLGLSAGIGLSAGVHLGIGGGGIGLGGGVRVGGGIGGGIGVGGGLGVSAAVGVGLGLSGSGVGATSSAQALEGESAADFLVRQGMDPALWRSVAGQTDDPSSLPAGADLAFSPSLRGGAGVGLASGHQSRLDASTTAVAGLTGGGMAAGFALAAAGGATSATETAAGDAASARAGATRQAFAIEVARETTRSQVDRSPLSELASSTPAARDAPPSPPPPHADRRATTFAVGVPLRDRVPTATAATRPVVALRQPATVETDRGRAAGSPCACLRCHPAARRCCG